MRIYCRAYKLADMQRYEEWNDKARQVEDLSPDSICYLWDDFVVVKSPVQEGGVLFDDPSENWKTFCTQTLHFSVPEDIV